MSLRSLSERIQILDPARFLTDPYQMRYVLEAEITINADTYRSAEIFGSVIGFVKQKTAAIEFVRAEGHDDPRMRIRGAVMRNEDGSAVAHVANALIGYGGSGPELSRHVLRLLGFSDAQFEIVNDVARPLNQYYDVSVSLV